MATSLVLVAATVVLHYGILLGCARWLPPGGGAKPHRVIVAIFAIIVAHAAEIWLLGFGYYVLADFEDLGAVIGKGSPLGVMDHVYFSGTVYSTVGFGDLYPMGPIRWMVVMEALTGLVMITWSASFTFLYMQRDWPWGDEDRHVE